MNSDAILKEFWKDNARFADLFNTVLFQGEEIVKPSELTELDTDHSLSYGTKGPKTESLSKYRDVVKWWNGLELAVLGIENQDKIHYAMPVRMNLYDSISYERQRRDIAKEHRERKDLEGEEFLSKFALTDRLTPVISIVIYYGERSWDGPKMLSEMLNVPEKLKPYINDYKINLFEINNSNGSEFKNAETRKILNAAYYIRKKELSAVNEMFDREQLHTLAAFVQSEKLMRLKVDEGGINMCTALDEMIKDGEARAEARGEAKGEARGEARGQAIGEKAALRRVVLNMKKQNVCDEIIANYTGLTIEEVQNIH